MGTARSSVSLNGPHRHSASFVNLHGALAGAGESQGIEGGEVAEV